MNDNPAIFATMIKQGALAPQPSELLTFVAIDNEGQFVDQTRNYRDLWENGQQIATVLSDLGVAKGEHFAVMMQNHAEFVDTIVASSILGTVFVPVDPKAKNERLKDMLEFSECTGAVVADYSLQAILNVQSMLPRLNWLVVLDTGALESLPESTVTLRWLHDTPSENLPERSIAVTDENEPMQLLFTSGTTGAPKAMVLSYSRYHRVISLAPEFGIVESDRLYTGLSLTHANAQMITMGMALKNGIPGIISGKFSKSRLWDICRYYRCTVFNLLGGMTTAIYSEPPRADDRDNPVRMVLSGGMPASIWLDFEQRFDVGIFEIYGASEGGNTFNPPGVGPVGSIGRPPEGLEAKVFNENGQECPPEVPGELAFRNEDGTCEPVAYFNDPEASDKKTLGGWLRMGDIVRADKDGWLFFEHRVGRDIRRNGAFINVSFVEKKMAEHPQVDDVFVYGIKTASGTPGEKEVVAAVVPERGAPDVSKVLFEHCRACLEANSVPSIIQIMTEIPKTASEKPKEQDCLAHLEANPNSAYRE
jgi:crotonobetaine/carnitine-CoA ligase